MFFRCPGHVFPAQSTLARAWCQQQIVQPPRFDSGKEVPWICTFNLNNDILTDGCVEAKYIPLGDSPTYVMMTDVLSDSPSYDIAHYSVKMQSILVLPLEIREIRYHMVLYQHETISFALRVDRQRSSLNDTQQEFCSSTSKYMQKHAELFSPAISSISEQGW